MLLSCHTKRREFIGLLGSAVAWPLAARAQQAGKVFRIGFVGLPTADSLPKRPEAFRTGLRDLGYQEGRNVIIEYHWADEHYERLPAAIGRLWRAKPEIVMNARRFIRSPRRHGRAATAARPSAFTVLAFRTNSNLLNRARRRANSWTPDGGSDRPVALDRHAAAGADLGVIVPQCHVLNAAIVPKCDRVGPPTKSHLEFRPGAVLE
jgi:hypothetical protein